MKKILYTLCIFLLLFYLILHPVSSSAAAGRGLVLWYTRLLPVLLPFSIISYLLIQTDSLSIFNRILHPILHLILPVSEDGVYPIFAGFLFSFPLGSQITTQLVKNHRLTLAEGTILICVSNNFGPAFLNSLVLTQTQFDTIPLYQPLLCLFAPSLLIGRIWYHYLQITNPAFAESQYSNKASRSQINFKIIDAGILNGFEILTKLGGYIMFFSILTDVICHLPLNHALFKTILIGSTEITNAVSYLTKTSLSDHAKILLALMFCSFGGISGLIQTCSVTSEIAFSIRSYLIFKILCTILTGILAFVLILN